MIFTVSMFLLYLFLWDWSGSKVRLQEDGNTTLHPAIVWGCFCSNKSRWVENFMKVGGLITALILLVIV